MVNVVPYNRALVRRMAAQLREIIVPNVFLYLFSSPSVGHVAGWCFDPFSFHKAFVLCIGLLSLVEVVCGRYGMQSAVLAIVNPSVCLSVCPSVTRWHCVKTTQATITGSSLYDSPMTLVSSWLTSPRNSKRNTGSEGAE